MKTIRVPEELVELIFGHNSEKIQAIEEKTGAKLFLLPPSSVHTERLCIIRGLKPAELAYELISDLIKSHSGLPRNAVNNQQNLAVSYRYRIPSIYAGIFTDALFKNFKEQSGAFCRFDLRSKKITNEKICIVRGTPDQVESAKRLIAEKLEWVVGTKEVTKALTSIIPHERLVNVRQLQQVQQQILHGSREEDEEDIAEEFDSMRVAETFAEYVPSKVKVGRKHPDPVVETTSLASVDPPTVAFNLLLPDSITNSETGTLSNLQIEAIVYACKRHDEFLPDGSRSGFLIGDGAGVGKGRTIAGIIFENHLRGRKKAVWISVSNDLKYDAERDLVDIGADAIKVSALNQMWYGKQSDLLSGSFMEGVMFSTYSTLIANSKKAKHTRLEQLIQWAGENFDGAIIFDECHKAKNIYPDGSKKSTLTGLAILQLQKKLPNARIIYASATGASEPKNMAYMVRLGLWGQGSPFQEFSDFIETVEKRGMGAMEMVAMEMKRKGMFMARQLSFSGAEYKVAETEISPEFHKSYDDSVKLWVDLLHSFIEAADLLNIGATRRKIMWSQFWSAHQRFFKSLCIASKVDHAVMLASEAVKSGKTVVIGLLSTGDSLLTEQLQILDNQLPEHFSTAEGVLVALINNHFPYRPKVDPPSLNKSASLLYQPSTDDSESLGDSDVSCGSIEVPPDGDSVEKANLMKEKLLCQIKVLGPNLPLNPLDELVQQLGGSQHVAEITGRKGRLLRMENGKLLYVSRSEPGVPNDMVNLKERERFMAGEKLIAIISEAGSCGFSFHADNRAANKRRRVHITLELPWAADRAIQQFGRTHRSNQASSPEYVLMISKIPGERRFASTVAKRLGCLGALTQGDRRVTEMCDLEQFNFDTECGRTALIATMKAVLGSEVPAISPPADYEGEFFKDMTSALIGVGLIRSSETGELSLDKDYANIRKFLNRLLGMPIDLQCRLFQYFTDTFEAVVNQAKRSGRYEMGIFDLGSGLDDVRRKKLVSYTTRHSTEAEVIQLHTFEVDGGLCWEIALDKCSELLDPHEGFYLTKDIRNLKQTPSLVMRSERRRQRDGEFLYSIRRPHTGLQVRQETLAEISNKCVQVQPDDAKSCWVELHASSKTACIHTYLYGKCRQKTKGECNIGIRYRSYIVLTGSVMSLWPKVESVLSEFGAKMQVVRLQLEGKRIVGILIPKNCIAPIAQLLTEVTDVSEESAV